MSQPQKKIILHIGGHKTGSTSLQSCLAQNTEQLEEQGIYYPLFGDDQTFTCCGREKIVNGLILQNQYYVPELLQAALEKFDSMDSLHTLIFSEENLFEAQQPPHALHHEALNKLQQYDTYVLVCLRRSVEYICGKWQESIRFNALRPLEKVLKKNSYKHSLKQLFTYADMFGKDKMMVEVYNTANQDDYDVMPQMLSALGIDNTQSIYISQTKKNTSVSRAALEARRFISHYTNIYLNNEQLEKYDAILQYGSKQSALYSLDDQQLQQVCDRHHPLECKVAKTFLAREALFESRYPSIYKTDRKIASNNIGSFKRALLRCVVRDIILTTYYRNPNFMQKICVYLWASISFKMMKRINFIHKKLTNKLRVKIDADCEWPIKIVKNIFKPYDQWK